MSGQVTYEDRHPASALTVTLLSENPNQTFTTEVDGTFSIHFHPVDFDELFRFRVKNSEGFSFRNTYEVITPGCFSKLSIVLVTDDLIFSNQGGNRARKSRLTYKRQPSGEYTMGSEPSRYGRTPASGPFPIPTSVPSATPAPSPAPSPLRLRTEGMSRPNQATKQTPRVITTPQSVPSPSMPQSTDSTVDQEKRQLDSFVADLHNGSLAFIVPPTMKQGAPVRVTVRISCEGVTAAMTEGLENSSFTQPEKIKVSPRMKVSLTGEDGAFKINRVNSSEEQIIEGVPFAQWEWEVIPQKWGKRSLYVSATVCVHVPGQGDKLQDVPVFVKPVEVKVSYKFLVTSFVSQVSNWSYLLGGSSILGLFVALWKKIRSRTSRNKAPSDWETL